jgi:hypothetical protein
MKPVAIAKTKTVHNIGYPPGITAQSKMSLYLKKATQAQIPLTNPASG